MSYEDFVVWCHGLTMGQRPTMEQWLQILAKQAAIRPIFASALFVYVEWIDGVLLIERAPG
jgi:hypothetical protein